MCCNSKFSDGSHIDVQPVFEIEDQDYKYPDTYNGGSWKINQERNGCNVGSRT
jgi:hypothetical protein